MQSRPRFWITVMVLTFIASLLVGFAPIRLQHGGQFKVNSKFTFEVGEALYANPEDITDRQQEVSDKLEAAGLTEAEVKILGEKTLSVETYAFDQDQADSDRELVAKTLKETFGTAEETSAPAAEQAQQPVAKWGPFAIFRPTPQFHLGLDLQGGAHVVLRCLPSAEMTFLSSDETKPLVLAEGAEVEPGAYKPPFNAEQLTLRIKNLLQQTGANPNEVDVSVAGANRLIVHTRPQDQREVDRQQAAIEKFLTVNYPGVQIEKGDVSAVFVDAGTADMVKGIIERRLVSLGEVKEPVIQKQGFDRIIVEMPGVKDPQRVLDILKSTALLEFRLVPARYKQLDNNTYAEWTDSQTNSTVTWDQVRAESEVEFTGRDLLPNAKVEAGQSADWVVAFELRPEKKDDFHEFTRKNVGRIMAIVLDRECEMAPVIRSAIPGQGIIEGNMTPEEASDLKLLLNAGALPVPLEIVENRTVSATLGQDSINRSVQAAFYGVIAVMIFMLAYYRLPGLLADIALILYMALVVAVTSYSKATLTLPGIAGIILSLGTAVDANVIIFERLKEELWAGRSMRAAVAAGFDRAWTAILDANVTTLITSAVLYWLGTSLIKGFAIMLSIGVVCHLFTAVTVTRWLLTMVVEQRWAQKRSLYGVGERSEGDETQLV